jgi:UDPglucose 6-dehydrogenase
MLREIERVNTEALEAVAAKVSEAVWNLEGKRIALLGLAFKPDTDDVRSSPALALARRLMDEGARVVAFDPQAAHDALEELPGLEIADGPYEAATGAHCLVLATEWDEFRRLDLARLRGVMAHPVVVDGRNALDPAEMRGAGFTYYPIGRPSVGGPPPVPSGAPEDPTHVARASSIGSWPAAAGRRPARG